MGVRGLTTFIAKNADQFFEDFELHDCNLVIDGNSLATQLYKYVSRCNSGFGGDYDVYYKSVIIFFEMLKACNIQSYVLFDGGYETRKKKSVYSRLVAKQQAASILCPANQKLLQIFPLMMKDVFQNALEDIGIPFMQCDFEADDEVSHVAQELSCPVLSNDSDFYIYDVEYISFTNLNRKVIISENGYSYLSCKLYKMQTFVNHFGGLKKEMLPLLATLLGNDYISRSTFKNFYAHLKLAKTKKKISDQQRTIIALLQWLRNETYTSAVEKILGRLKLAERPQLLSKINKNVSVYGENKSNATSLLGVKKSIMTEKIIDSRIETIKDKEFLNYLDVFYMNDVRDLQNEEMENNFYKVPTWFRFLYNKGVFPKYFMDLLISKIIYSNPQLEDLNYPDSNTITFPILAFIFKLINYESDNFTYVGRNDHNHIVNHKLEVSELFTNLKFPKIDVLNHFYPASDPFLSFFEETIQLKSFDILNPLPKHLHLYVISIMWFSKNIVEPKLSAVHIHSLILCLIYLQFINPIVDTCKNFSKLEKRLNALDETISEETEHISQKECYKTALKMVDYFKLDEKLKISNKLFSRKTVHVFSMFQNVVYQLNALNSLLGYPMQKCRINEFYNGTFIYNAYNHLKSRNNILAYIELLFKESPALFNNYKSLFDKIQHFLRDILTEDKIKKTRKRNKTPKLNITKNEEQIQNSCSDTESMDNDFDTTNNMYWLLNKANC